MGKHVRIDLGEDHLVRRIGFQERRQLLGFAVAEVEPRRLFVFRNDDRHPVVNGAYQVIGIGRDDRTGMDAALLG